MILITESKRDDLLLPYYEKVRSIYPNLSLGKFKEMMLRKLAAQGCINNLSLSSNYYLAGATRYYFQGMLTTDGQTHILSGNPDEPDNWNVEVCKRLNALINVLRNAYIDSVGTQFEQPEDFGELPLPKLLRKYGKKIDTELGIERTPKTVAPELDRNEHVGNGYTFEIIYSYGEATKYNVYTAPGAWCITYGQGHYDYYINTLDIHYVIFRKDGFENVRRPNMPVNKRKPHDEYGNSLIAFLQSNKGPRGIYITSRWNHGYGESSGTEADHAYTNEEFMEITGVTEKDLERIYNIWKTDVKHRNTNRSKSELKAVSAPILRSLKYIQMLINGGENIERAAQLSEMEIINSETIIGNGDARKSIIKYTMKSRDNHEVEILSDKGKFLFETVCLPGDENRTIFSSEDYYHNKNLAGLVIIGEPDNYKLYNTRFHEFVNVGGTTTFRRIPSNRNIGKDDELMFMEVKNGMKDIVLLSTSTWRPLKLPNGQYWFNDIHVGGSTQWERGGQIHCHGYGVDNGPVFEIIYDESSGEKYFYCITNGKFLTWINKLKPNKRAEYDNGTVPMEQYKPCIVSQLRNGTSKYIFISFSFRPNTTWYGYATDPAIYTIDGVPFSIYGSTEFKNPNIVERRYLRYEEPGVTRYGSSKFYFYDLKVKKLLAIGDNALKTRGGYLNANGNYSVLDAEEMIGGHRASYILDMASGLFFKNTTNFAKKYKSYYTFPVDEFNDSGEVVLWNDNFSTWSYYTALNDLSDTEMMERYGTTDKWEAAGKEEAKHQTKYNIRDFELVPNNLPVNDESQTAASPAMSLSEAEIKDMVNEVIKKVIGEIKS